MSPQVLFGIHGLVMVHTEHGSLYKGGVANPLSPFRKHLAPLGRSR